MMELNLINIGPSRHIRQDITDFSVSVYFLVVCFLLSPQFIKLKQD